uniref:Peptidoglycan recognition protein family domain-containing protein n=1 Tax=Glossina austeni TaxID=7395 RepID=A0A1A9UH99_GLOAU
MCQHNIAYKIAISPPVAPVAKINAYSKSLVFVILHFCVTLTITKREDWYAEPPKNKPKLIMSPAEFVIIHHTEYPLSCHFETNCLRIIKSLQKHHMYKESYDDIGYNFLIAFDGHIYEGRGWGVQAQHPSAYKFNSIGIACLGNFDDDKPDAVMLQNIENLIDEAIVEGHLQSDYILLGHRQIKTTSCPGENLYNFYDKNHLESHAAVNTWNPTPQSTLGIPRRSQNLESHAAVRTWNPTLQSVLGIPRRSQNFESHAAVKTLNPTPQSELGVPRCSQNLESHAAVSTWNPTPQSELGIPRRSQHLESHAAVSSWNPTPQSALGIPRRSQHLESHAAVRTWNPTPQSELGIPRRSQNLESHAAVST